MKIESRVDTIRESFFLSQPLRKLGREDSTLQLALLPWYLLFHAHFLQAVCTLLKS